MALGSLSANAWPTLLHEHCAVAGVFVGGCVARGVGSRFRAKAHAHTSGPYKGWLCFLSAARLSDNALVIHELAHILSGKGHTNEWRQMVVNLGGTLSETDSLKDYHARAKRPGRYSGLAKQHSPKCPCGGA